MRALCVNVFPTWAPAKVLSAVRAGVLVVKYQTTVRVSLGVSDVPPHSCSLL